MVEKLQSYTDNAAYFDFETTQPALNTNAKEFVPASMSAIKKAVVDDVSILSRYQKQSTPAAVDLHRMQEVELKKTQSSQSTTAHYWIYWSKNLFTYILQFFEVSHHIPKKLRLASTRTRGAVLDSIPLMRRQVAKNAPYDIQKVIHQ